MLLVSCSSPTHHLLYLCYKLYYLQVDSNSGENQEVKEDSQDDTPVWQTTRAFCLEHPDYEVKAACAICDIAVCHYPPCKHMKACTDSKA